MKTSRAFALAAAALAVGFLTARWCTAQSSNQLPTIEPARNDFGAFQQLKSLVTYLQDTKQTNILQRFNNYSNASLASQDYSKLGRTLAILQRLRDGRTSEAYELLEGHLDDDIICFAGDYRHVSQSGREQADLKVFVWARDYRAKHPSPEHMDYALAGAFKLLDEK